MSPRFRIYSSNGKNVKPNASVLQLFLIYCKSLYLHLTPVNIFTFFRLDYIKLGKLFTSPETTLENHLTVLPDTTLNLSEMQIHFSIKKKTTPLPKFPEHELASTSVARNTRWASASCYFFPEVSTVGLLANKTWVRFTGQKDHLLCSVSHSIEMPMLGCILPVHII